LPAISSTDLGFFENTAVHISFTAHIGFIIASAVLTAFFCINFQVVEVGFNLAILFLLTGSARFATVHNCSAVSCVHPALLVT